MSTRANGISAVQRVIERGTTDLNQIVEATELKETSREPLVKRYSGIELGSVAILHIPEIGPGHLRRTLLVST